MIDFGTVIQRLDGSFVINKDGNTNLPYHVPNQGEFTELYAVVKAYADANPGKVAIEQPYVPPPPTIEEQQAFMVDAIQYHLDIFAQSRGYDGILSACSYYPDADPQFKLEGEYAVWARGATWRAAYAVLAAVLSGQRPMPTLEEVIAELPVLKWPDEGEA